MAAQSDAADSFFAGFYRNPDPHIAAGALVHVLRNPGRTPQDRVLTMFVRAAQISEGLRAEFHALSQREPEFAEVVSRILTAAADPAFPDPARCELVRPEHLDFLWSEFLLTGSEAPVHRIASVLERDDLMLRALTQWASEPVYMPWSKAAKTRFATALLERGISVDLQRPRLGNDRDVDLLVWKLMSGGFQVKSAMPFAITDEIVSNMMMKGAACWSLQSNANTHSVVRAIYESLPDKARHPRFV